MGGIVLDGGGSNPPAAPSDSSSSSSSSSNSSNSGSSSGDSSSGSKNKLQPYIQEYQLIFDSNVKVNMKLVKMAEEKNWSLRYFRMQVRLRDPRYFKSTEAKQRALEFTEYWKAVLPGVKVKRGLMRDYLRSSWNQQQLQRQVMKMPAFRKQYAYYNKFAAAQRAEGFAKNVNPLAYKQYQQTFRGAYQQLGIEPPAGFERAFFSSGMSDKDFLSNLETVSRGASAAQWDIGGLTAQQQKAGLFNQKGAAQVRGLLQTALAKQQGYMRAAGSDFRISEDNDLVTMKGL